MFPAHDYKGDTVSTIGEEKRYNPRLQVKSVDEYVELMGNLKLPNPKMMDVVVPANMHVGLHQDELAKQRPVATAQATRSQASAGPISCWSTCARPASGTSMACWPARCMRPMAASSESLRPGGMLREVAAATGRRVVFFCAFGERSAMAVNAAKDAGLANTAHIEGGMDAWKKAGGPVVQA